MKTDKKQIIKLFFSRIDFAINSMGLKPSDYKDIKVKFIMYIHAPRKLAHDVALKEVLKMAYNRSERKRLADMPFPLPDEEYKNTLKRDAKAQNIILAAQSYKPK